MTTTKEIVEKSLLGVMGLAISVAGFLVKWQLTELTETIKLQGSQLTQMQIEVAVTVKDVQLHRDWLQSYQGRIQYLEARTERMNVHLENHTKRN